MKSFNAGLKNLAPWRGGALARNALTRARPVFFAIVTPP